MSDGDTCFGEMGVNLRLVHIVVRPDITALVDWV